MSINPLEQTYAEAADAYDRHRRANSMPTTKELDRLERLIYAVSIRNGVVDFMRSEDGTWTVNCHFTVSGRANAHCVGRGDTMLDAASEALDHVSEECRWQGAV